MRLIAVFIGLFVALAPGVAYAYVGPGLGLGAVAAVLSVIFSSILAVLAIVWYPVKRLFRKYKRSNPTAKSPATPPERTDG